MFRITMKDERRDRRFRQGLLLLLIKRKLERNIFILIISLHCKEGCLGDIFSSTLLEKETVHSKELE